MSLLNQMDLIVGDVPAAADFLAGMAGMELRVKEERFAELHSGAFTLMLSLEALVPTEPARGVILHFQVEDVKAAIEAAREKGAPVILEPMFTEWGWESAMIAGPENIIVDFYRLVGA